MSLIVLKRKGFLHAPHCSRVARAQVARLCLHEKAYGSNYDGCKATALASLMAKSVKLANSNIVANQAALCT